MQPKTLDVQGIPIAYYESAGQGLPVLLLHGNSTSGRTFIKQLDSDLGQQYRLIAPDLPGFGLSQPLDDPSTQAGLRPWACTMTALLDALGVREVVVLGWSLGGHIALEMAPSLPKLKGVVIYGTPPLGMPPAMDKAFLPHPNMEFTFKEQLTEEQMDSYVGSFFAADFAERPAQFLEDIRRADGRARGVIAQNVMQADFLDELKVVAELQAPLAILHGANEQLVNGDYFASVSAPTLWRNEVQVIEGAGHAPHWETPEEFNALVAAFLADVA
jgi:pimeloyl-ACP methyl ester carboxylesterase